MQPIDYIIWHITESEAELKAMLEHREYYADKVANLKPGSKRLLEILATRVALKELFHGVEQRVLYHDDGAPYLEGGPYLGISHSHQWAFVMTYDRPIGIDIEVWGNRVERVVGQFLTDDELIVLQMSATTYPHISLPDHQSPLSVCYHLAWCAKEAAYKILGHDYYDLQALTSVIHID